MEIMNYELLAEMGIYIQKSKTFIWPIINFKVEPIETYLKFGNVDTADERLLIALFHNKNEHYKKHIDELKENKYYDFTFTDDEFDIVVFTMNSIKKDYDKICEGRYSELSENFKLIISVTEKNKVVLKCLNPENNYKEFARALGIYDHDLEGKELLSPPNLESESINVTDKIKKEIADCYGLVEEV